MKGSTMTEKIIYIYNCSYEFLPNWINLTEGSTGDTHCIKKDQISFFKFTKPYDKGEGDTIIRIDIKLSKLDEYFSIAEQDEGKLKQLITQLQSAK